MAAAPQGIRRALRLASEDGKVVWWWPMLRLVARKRQGPSFGPSP